MRIDRPIGNESNLTGSFSGSFYGYFQGELEGLSESVQRIYDTIDEVSQSVDWHLTDVSSSISGTINDLSGSFDYTISQLSSSAESTIEDVSASIVDTIFKLSGSFDQDRTILSRSFDDTVHEVSSSISGTISGLSGSFDYDRTILSQSFDADRTKLSGSFAATIYSDSQSISGTIDHLSHSFDLDRTILSQSFAGTIRDLDRDLQSQIDNTRATYTTTESFNQYKQQVDETYYKSGSSAILQDLLVSKDVGVQGNVTILGNITVEGSSSIIHSEDVTIKDKFVEIASGAASPMEANEAGFGIQGANVSMSYSAMNDSMNLNKPLVAPSFTGSLFGDVQGNVTGSLEGTASYASEIGDDGTIARAIKNLENVARVKTENADRGRAFGIFYLSCGAHKDYQSCSVVTPTLVLDLPDRVIPGVEHYVLISNVGNQDCIVTGSEGVMVPPSVLDRYAWEYRYEYKYIEYTVPDVQITATQNIPGYTRSVFDGHIDGGNSTAVTGSRSIYIDGINVQAQATVPTPLTGSFAYGSGGGSGSGSFENNFMVPQGQRLCLSYFTVDTDTIVITSAQRLRG